MQKIEAFMENVSFSSTTISGLVNDLLDLAKMESNNFQFNEDYFDLVTSIKQSIEQQKFLSGKKDITFKCIYKTKILEKQKSLVLNESYVSEDEDAS
jgi:signal transduction histidine kinase